MNTLNPKMHTNLLGEPSGSEGITVTVTIMDVFSRSTIWSWDNVATATLQI
jgi:hypothetical protein